MHQKRLFKGDILKGDSVLTLEDKVYGMNSVGNGAFC